MKTPEENLAILTKFVEEAPREPAAEEFVRGFVGRAAKSCPMDVLVRIGQLIVDIRRSQLHGDVERN
jgi:hypothetical protein